jgi:hypothetical protein
MIFSPNWIARGPPDPSTVLELVTSGVSGPKPKLVPAAAEGSVKEITASRPSKWIGDIGVVKNIEELGPKLGFVAFPERPGFRHLEVHINVRQA